MLVLWMNEERERKRERKENGVLDGDDKQKRVKHGLDIYLYCVK